MKKRKSTFKGFRGVGKPKREWQPSGPPVELGGTVRRLGRADFFNRLSDKGRGRVLNLIRDPKRTKRVWVGRDDLGTVRFVPGTGSASRLPKPQLLAIAADIAKHLDVKQYEVN